jgi:hypothetical protein
MKKRSKMSRRSSRRNFRAGARVKSRNFLTGSMRGGIRL